MRHAQVKQLSSSDFRRLTGIQPSTFDAMLELLEAAEVKRKENQRHRGGRRPKLSMGDKLLLTLEYLREYRTQFHIGQNYGVSESSAGVIIRWVEDTLIQSGDFSLPGKRALLTDEIEYHVVAVDATESPIERPKKSKNTSIQEKRSSIRSNSKS